MFYKIDQMGMSARTDPPENNQFPFIAYSQTGSVPLLSIGTPTCPDSNPSFAEGMCKPFTLLLSFSQTVQGTDAQRIPVDVIDFVIQNCIYITRRGRKTSKNDRRVRENINKIQKIYM